MRLLTTTLSVICCSFLITGCSWHKHNADESNDYPFFEKKDYDKRKYAFGHDFPTYKNTDGKRTLVFDPHQTAWAAYDSDGYLVKTGEASGGRDYCPDIGKPCKTAAGTYTVTRKGGANCVSSKYPVGRGGAPMPYCMFFHGGYAIHGSDDVPNYNASHGCIRVEPHDAQWLSENFVDIGTKVVVNPY